MKNPPKQPEPKNLQKSIQIIHGKRTETSLNVAIVGGGKTCHSLLQILDEDRLSRLKMKILGVADVNPRKHPGFDMPKT